MTIRFATLGPAGSCHHYALRHYLDFQEISDESEISFVQSFGPALDALLNGEIDHIVQGCVHPEVLHLIESHHREVFVIDSFLFATQEMALLVRRDVKKPKTLGLMPATGGYVDLNGWEHITHEISKPVVGAGLLAGKYDAGISYTHIADARPDILRVEEVIGCVVQPWLVYGTRPRFNGQVIAAKERCIFSSAIEKNWTGIGLEAAA